MKRQHKCMICIQCTLHIMFVRYNICTGQMNSNDCWILVQPNRKFTALYVIYPEVLEGLFSNLFEGRCNVRHGLVLILLMVNGFVPFPPGQKDGTFDRPTRFFLACYSSVNRPPPICCSIGRVFRHIICKYMNMTY